MSSRKREKSQPKPKRKARPILLVLTITYAFVVLLAPHLPPELLIHALLCYAPPQLLCIPLVCAGVPSLYLLIRKRFPRIQLLTLLIITVSIPFIYSYELNLFKPRAVKPNLRVLTCNILFTTREVPGMLDYIRKERVDLIFLQENEGGSESPSTYLSSRLPDYHLFADGSTAILSRWPLTETKSIQQHSLEQRRILTAKVNAPTPFRAVTMHWSVPQISRNLKNFQHSIPMQIEDCNQLQQVIEDERLPLIFGGDFNNPPRHALTHRLRQHYSNAFSEVGSGPGITFASNYPFVRIDHLYTNSKIQPISCAPGPSFGSDHLSLRGDFTFTTSLK
ncbi:MAG: endonuclease/exonuclease/phosphatase family protein [Fimbriimonadaceae bacterium]